VIASANGTRYTLDQNGNVTWQEPEDGAVMSWTGNWYVPTSSSSRVLAAGSAGLAARAATVTAADQQDQPPQATVTMTSRPPIGFQICHAAFNGGNPSMTRAAVRLVQVRTFAPFGIWDESNGTREGQANASYIETFPHRTGLGLTVEQVWMGPDATRDRFLGALQVPNSIVGYLDHGFWDTKYGVRNGVSIGSVGICFYGNECLVSRKLLGIPVGVILTYPGYDVKPIDDYPDSNSTLVFLAACDLRKNFISWWVTSMGVDQALIHPIYADTNPANDMYLPDAAIEWRTMLRALAKGATIGNAVDNVGNSEAKKQHATHTWKWEGNSDISFTLH
jgi:hypothetical protein